MYLPTFRRVESYVSSILNKSLDKHLVGSSLYNIPKHLPRPSSCNGHLSELSLFVICLRLLYMQKNKNKVMREANISNVDEFRASQLLQGKVKSWYSCLPFFFLSLAGKGRGRGRGRGRNTKKMSESDGKKESYFFQWKCCRGSLSSSLIYMRAHICPLACLTACNVTLHRVAKFLA